jgi:hypothetical protein
MAHSLKIVDRGILSREPGRGAYMPIITPLSDGKYIAVQHVGQALDSGDNSIEVLHSTDGGRTWEAAPMQVEGGFEPGWAYRAPQVRELEDGKLVMAATRFVADGRPLFDPVTESLQRPEMLLFWSSDRGKTWSKPKTVPVNLPPDRYTWNGSGALTILTPNRWMYCFETWKPYGYVGAPDQKAGAVFSSDQGQTWNEMVIIADDPTGKLYWWDQMQTVLSDGSVYVMFWVHRGGTHEDTVNHWSISKDQGRTWSKPKETNLRGQLSAPIPLPDNRVAAIYNYRHEPQGIHLAVSDDLTNFDSEQEIKIFDAGAEATLGRPSTDTFMAAHVKIAFGRPGGMRLSDGTLLVWYWCTVEGVTQTRWARVTVD